MEERRNNSVLQAEFDGLKELITVKFDNVCNQVKKMDITLQNHNGRLGTVERIIEQTKGAGKMMQLGWMVFAFVVGGLIFPLIIKAIGF